MGTLAQKTIEQAIGNNGCIQAFPEGLNLGLIAHELYKMNPALKTQYPNALQLVDAIVAENANNPKIKNRNLILKDATVNLQKFLPPASPPPSLRRKPSHSTPFTEQKPRLASTESLGHVDHQATQPVAPIKNSPSSDSRTNKVVVIDAGHGGNDSGATRVTGHNAVHEKEYTLKNAKVLGAELERQGYTVYYTRTDDSYISIADRKKRIRQVNPDLLTIRRKWLK